MRSKIFISGLLFFLTIFPLLSQEKAKEPATKLEGFLAKKGKLFIKDSYELGEIISTGKITVDALVIYEPGLESQKIKGIRVEITESGRLERSNISFLDLEEIESLSKAIGYMADLVEKWKVGDREPYSEVTYSTKGDFNFGFYQKGKNRGLFSSSGYIGKTTIFMKVEDLAKLKDIIDNGLSLLESK